MITRTGIFEGRIRPGCEVQLFARIRDQLAPLWLRFPHAQNVRWLRVRQSDPEAPATVMIQQIDYPDLAALGAAPDSPIRCEARAVTLELMELFEGRFYHMVSDHNRL